MAAASDQPSRPDLATRDDVEQFVDRFYEKVLNDPQLAPIFLDVAEIDLAVHLPHIKRYWCKLLLGEEGYRRHTMNIHRALHAKQALTPDNFARWLQLFTSVLDEHYAGPGAEKARRIAHTIAANMQAGLSV